ncbi:hypothetical protein [Helicobacter sp. T3_23-1056]
MEKEVVKEIAKKLPAKATMTALQATEAIKMVLEAHKENEITKRQIAEINAKKEVLITEIKERYDFYRYIFDNVFSERREVMNKQFEIIDKGIADNNEKLVSMGLENLSKVVSSSPIAEAIKLKNLIENGGKIEL